MMHLNTAALHVAAQDSCAKRPQRAAPCPASRILFAPCHRWDLLDLVTEARRALALTSNDITVLRALLSFLPLGKNDGPVTPDTLTTVFAGNAQISRRAAGMDERVLRSAFQRLIRAGLLRRRDSATGKRFPVRVKGRIVEAYGLDLAPAFAQAPRLRDIVREHRAEAETCRALRAQILAMRRALLDRITDLTQPVRDWLDGLTRALRRKLKPSDLETVLHEMTLLDPADPTQSTAADGEIIRHIESEDRNKKTSARSERTVVQTCWAHCHQLHAFFAETPTTMDQLRDTLLTLAQMVPLPADVTAQAVQRLGWCGFAEALDTLAKHIHRIANPAAYFLRLIMDRPPIPRRA